MSVLATLCVPFLTVFFVFVSSSPRCRAPRHGSSSISHWRGARGESTGQYAANRRGLVLDVGLRRTMVEERWRGFASDNG